MVRGKVAGIEEGSRGLERWEGTRGCAHRFFSLIRFLSNGSVTVEIPYLLFLDEVTPRPLITTGGPSFAYCIYFHFHVHAESIFFFLF